MTRLKFERLQREWSLQKLGVVAGMQGSEISKVERGILKPYRSQLEKLARALGVPGAELLLEVSEDALEVSRV
jgi:transcriptional regulator with XRE-family HTH domain